MDIKPIRSEQTIYQAALREVESLMTPEFGTLEDDRLDVLATLVKAYKAKHFPMEVAAPVEAIKFQMDQEDLTVKDLESMIGRSNRVYQVVDRIMKWSNVSGHLDRWIIHLRRSLHDQAAPQF
jgi:HTH-type transcriptional regulator / antitoxin HigA